jgi:hypothetical protein
MTKALSKAKSTVVAKWRVIRRPASGRQRAAYSPLRRQGGSILGIRRRRYELSEATRRASIAERWDPKLQVTSDRVIPSLKAKSALPENSWY